MKDYLEVSKDEGMNYNCSYQVDHGKYSPNIIKKARPSSNKYQKVFPNRGIEPRPPR